MYVLEHVCRCGHVWRMSYEPGSVVHPTCPGCDMERRMTLRSRCLSAMTEAMVDVGPDALLDDYAVACLDALLGVLEEGADEWIVERAHVFRPAHEVTLLRRISTKDVHDLLAVLKPTTEEDL